MTENSVQPSNPRNIPIIDPTPARKKRIIEIFNRFLEDKISIAELKGIGKDKLFQLAEAGWVKIC